uniref:60Kd inner membrane protein n=1 Tax=Wuchereria bancrofti TaxID=6293 RepID=A0AAF5RX91_WUCBA
MLSRNLQVMLRLRRHLLTELTSLSSLKMSSRLNVVITDHCQLISQIRHISFFGSGQPSSTSLALPEISATPADTSLVSTDATDFTLMEQLQLGLVKDFHLFDFLGGNSLVKEYDLFSWWSPASWFRLALEYMHFNIDLPWWLTVICATISLRLMMIFVPIASHRLMARVQLYKKEIDDFKEIVESAQRSGNFLQTMEAQKELKDFLKTKDIKLYRQFIFMSLNGAIFMTQFIAVKKMADVAFPGMSTGGLYWFKDLTVPDPYYLLPLVSAITVAAVFKIGAETGGTNQGVSPQIQKMLTRIGPIIVFACSTKVSSVIALYWCTSNMISVMFSGIFKIPSVRAFLKIPQLPSKQVQLYKKALNQNINHGTMQKQNKEAFTGKTRSGSDE